MKPTKIFGFLTITLVLILTGCSSDKQVPNEVIKDFGKICNIDFYCGTYDAPLDYDTSGKTIAIAYSLHLVDRNKPFLFVNPGGPGGSGVNYVYNYKTYFTPAVYENFNLIGIDTRGSNLSGALRCLSDQEEDLVNSFNPSPATLNRFTEYYNTTSILFQSCSEKYDQDLKHYNLDNIVKDFEVARKYFKLPSFNFLGKSYGAAIGVRYQELYPLNSGAVIVDGLPSIYGDTADAARVHVSGLEITFDHFKSYLDSQDSALGGSELDSQIDAIYRSLSTPVLIPGTAYYMDQTLFTAALTGSLYQGYRGYDNLIKNLEFAKKGDYNNLYNIGIGLIGKSSKGTYSDMVDYSYIITCQSVKSASLTKLYSTLISNPDSIFASYNYAAYIPCLHFKFEPSSSVASNQGKFLILANAFDPITPIQSALEVSKQFPNAILLTNQGDSHTVYSTTSTCADQAVYQYLTDQTLTNSNCKDDHPVGSKYDSLK